MVKLLLNNSRIKISNDTLFPLEIASEKGFSDIVNLLLNDKRIMPNHKNFPLLLSSTNGHIEVVKLLLEDNRVDPSIDRNFVIQKALESNQYDIIGLLWNDQRVKKTLQKDLPELYDLFMKEKIKYKMKDF